MKQILPCMHALEFYERPDWAQYREEERVRRPPISVSLSFLLSRTESSLRPLMATVYKYHPGSLSKVNQSSARILLREHIFSSTPKHRSRRHHANRWYIWEVGRCHDTIPLLICTIPRHSLEWDLDHTLPSPPNKRQGGTASGCGY